MRRAILLLAIVLPAQAQDAEMVLRTLVGYTAMSNTRQLTPEQKAEVATLGQQAQSAARQGQFGEAMRHYLHGTAVMQGREWTPEAEFAAALQARVDDAIADPGQKLQLTLTPLYKITRPVETKLKLTLNSTTTEIQVSSQTSPIEIPVPLPPTLTGNHEITAEIAGQKKPVQIRIEALAPAANQLKARLEKVKEPNAEYALELYKKAEQGEANPQKTDFKKLFAEANDLLDQSASGANPFANRTGDMKRVYRSEVDQTLQPYRVYVPANYNKANPTPLVIALHGMGGSQDSFFDGYDNGVIKKEAEKHGFLMACPKGRGTASMYRGTAEKDVMDVLAQMQKEYNVDPKSIFLMGHSMGAYGTWSIAMAHPKVFAALGPISGGGDPAGVEKIKGIPQYIVHGDSDRTVNVSQSGVMVEAGKKLGTKIEYIEVPKGGHVDIAIPNFAPMFAFFNKLVPGTS